MLLMRVRAELRDRPWCMWSYEGRPCVAERDVRCATCTRRGCPRCAAIALEHCAACDSVVCGVCMPACCWLCGGDMCTACGGRAECTECGAVLEAKRAAMTEEEKAAAKENNDYAAGACIARMWWGCPEVVATGGCGCLASRGGAAGTP